MVFSRVSSLSIHNATMSDINRVMSNITDLHKKISSEKAVSSFIELSESGKIERTIDFEGKLRANSDYVLSNQTVLNRLNQTDIATSKIVSVADDFRKALTTKRSPSGDSMEFLQIADSSLKVIAENLNLNFEGRYLFAGSKTNFKPVDDIASMSNMIEGTATDNYYNGDNITISSKAGNNLNVQYGVKANEEGFQELIGAIHTAIQGHNDKNEALVAKAMDLASDAIGSLVQIRARITNNINLLDKTNETHKSMNIYLNEVLNADLKTDIPKATLELSSNEATLRATYMTFSRLSRLSLTQFL